MEKLKEATMFGPEKPSNSNFKIDINVLEKACKIKKAQLKNCTFNIIIKKFYLRRFSHLFQIRNVRYNGITHSLIFDILYSILMASLFNNLTYLRIVNMGYFRK